jgi:hypothetical protein
MARGRHPASLDVPEGVTKHFGLQISDCNEESGNKRALKTLLLQRRGRGQPRAHQTQARRSIASRSRYGKDSVRLHR